MGLNCLYFGIRSFSRTFVFIFFFRYTRALHTLIVVDSRMFGSTDKEIKQNKNCHMSNADTSVCNFNGQDNK